MNNQIATNTRLDAGELVLALTQFNYNLPRHVVRRITLIACGRRLLTEDSRNEMIDAFMRRYPTKGKPRHLRRAAAATERRYGQDGAGRLAEWMSFRNFAKKQGCNDRNAAWIIWTTPASWSAKCAALAALKK